MDNNQQTTILSLCTFPNNNFHLYISLNGIRNKYGMALLNDIKYGVEMEMEVSIRN